MTSVEEKGEGMWRTEHFVMGIFPTAQLLYCARAEDTPQCSAAGGRFDLAALLCTPIYVYGVCIEYACAVHTQR